MTRRGRKTPPADVRLHRRLGVELFNRTWALLDKKRRSPSEDDEMLHAAHASRYHWGRAGGPLNVSIGEWQISRVYAVLGRPEPALFHGRRALEVARRGHLGRFYVAYGYEALARAAAVAGRVRDRDRWWKKARRTGESVRDADDRRMLFEDLASIRGAS